MPMTEQEILEGFTKPTQSLTMFSSTKGDLCSNYFGRPCHAQFNLAVFENVRNLKKLGVFLNKLSDCAFVYKSKGPEPTEKTPELFSFVKEHYFGEDSPWKEVCKDVEFIEHPEYKYWYICIDFENNPNFSTYTLGHVALLANFVVALRNIFESSNKTRNMVTLVKHGVPFRRAIITSALFSNRTFEEDAKGVLKKMAVGSLNPGHWFTGYQEADSFFCGSAADLKNATASAKYHRYDNYLWPELKEDFFLKLHDFLKKCLWSDVAVAGNRVKGRFSWYLVVDDPEYGATDITVADLARYIKEYPNE